MPVLGGKTLNNNLELMEFENEEDINLELQSFETNAPSGSINQNDNECYIQNNKIQRVLILNQIPSADNENVSLRKRADKKPGEQHKHHEGKVKIQYIKNDTERSKTLSVRRKTLFKKVKSKNLFYNLLNLNYEKSKLG